MGTQNIFVKRKKNIKKSLIKEDLICCAVVNVQDNLDFFVVYISAATR